MEGMCIKALFVGKSQPFEQNEIMQQTERMMWTADRQLCPITIKKRLTMVAQ